MDYKFSDIVHRSRRSRPLCSPQYTDMGLLFCNGLFYNNRFVSLCVAPQW